MVNRVPGLRNLADLATLTIAFKPTTEMKAGLMTKFMKKGILLRCRSLIGRTAPQTA